jgi:hypothetical protein
MLAPGEQRVHAAAFFAGAAALHIGDLAWLEAELANLTTAIETSLASGQAAQAGALARALQPLLVLRGYWGGWGRAIDWAAQAAEASGDRDLEAWALHERGTRAGLLGDTPTAAAHLTRALRLREALRDRAGAAASEHNLAFFGTPASPGAPGAETRPPVAAPTIERPLPAIAPAITRRLPRAEQAAARRLPVALIVAVAAVLVLAGVAWLTLAPLFSAGPPVAAPTAPAAATSGAIVVAVPSAAPATASPAAASPTIQPTATTVAATLAPTATRAPTQPGATSTPTRPAATSLPTCQVAADRVNVRAGPGTVYPAVAQSLSSGAVLEPLARDPSGSWLSVRVQATGQRGWVNVAASLLDCTIAIDGLPIGAVPPTPRPAPTATPAPPPTATEAPAPSATPAAATPSAVAATATLAAAPTPSATATAAPPTATAVPPTDTLLPAPTSTLTPPTTTVTPTPCSTCSPTPELAPENP